MCPRYFQLIRGWTLSTNILVHFNQPSKSSFHGNIRKFSERGRPVRILGIETSCDDTGVAIVDGNGVILGHALHSQQSTHLSFGGIIPPVAREMHRQYITDVCEQALRSAKLRLRDIDAVAVTVKPGLVLSLMVGRNFAQYLSKTGSKPLIPIHHMQAHALTARMVEKVDFPFLVLLISGGHSLLALVHSATKFSILGTTGDNAPGEIFDKAARRLKLSNIPDYRGKCGGVAIELAASKATDPLQFEFPLIMSHYRDCNFSFSGLKNKVYIHIHRQEVKHGVSGDEIVPDYENLCAAFQLAIARHISHRTARAMEFLIAEKLLPPDRQTLVVSGGVACNDFVARALKIIADERDFRLVRPPPLLCMDNGVMIAWNGVERWKTDSGILRDPADIGNVEIKDRARIGDDWTQRVRDAEIHCKAVKPKDLYKTIYTAPNNYSE